MDKRSSYHVSLCSLDEAHDLDLIWSPLATKSIDWDEI